MMKLFNKISILVIIFVIMELTFLGAIFFPMFPFFHSLSLSTTKYFQNISKWSNTPPSNENEKIERFLYIIPFWFGTDYDFNGNSAVPYNNSIACGYFVNRILNDMGFTNNVSELSQLPANQIINFYSSEDNIFFSYSETDNFGYITSNLENADYGLYLIGLDTHIGFIYKSKNQYFFIHSSERFPGCVISENMFLSQTIKESKVIYIGKV